MKSALLIFILTNLAKEDCAIQSQTPFHRDDDPQEEALNTKPTALHRDEESSKLQVVTGNSPVQRIACDSTT